MLKINRQWILVLSALSTLFAVVAIIFLFPSTTVRASQPAITNTTSVFLPLVMNASSSPFSVSIHNFAFDPQVITVTVGTQVKWTNNDPFAHTVTSGTCTSTISCTPSGMFDSSPPPAPALSGGQSYTFTFNTAGSFAYYCRIHLGAMTGTVNVTH